MPESPLWLANHGRGATAAAIVRDKLGAGIAPPSITSAAPAVHGRWRQLLSPAWRRRTLVACAFFTCQVIPYFAVGTFVSQVMSAMNLKSGYIGGLIYNLSLLGGAILGLMVVDRISRRRFLLGTFGTAAMTMFVLSVWNDIPAVAMIILFAVFVDVLAAPSNLHSFSFPDPSAT